MNIIYLKKSVCRKISNGQESHVYMSKIWFSWINYGAYEAEFGLWFIKAGSQVFNADTRLSKYSSCIPNPRQKVKTRNPVVKSSNFQTSHNTEIPILKVNYTTSEIRKAMTCFRENFYHFHSSFDSFLSNIFLFLFKEIYSQDFGFLFPDNNQHNFQYKDV